MGEGMHSCQRIPFPGRGLTLSIDNSSAIQIIGGNFYDDAVSGNDSDKVLAHLAGNMGQDFVSIVEFDPKLRVRQRLDDAAFDLNGLFFGHKTSTFDEMKNDLEPTGFGNR
jgi:hypothetical protein